jgi:thymidylate synthase
MAHLIEADRSLDAWIAASDYIISEHRSVDNLLVTIRDPTFMEPTWLNQYNPRSVLPKAMSLQNIVNTIFPMNRSKRIPNRSELYGDYLSIFERRRKGFGWGTYFQRLISFGPNNVNQLEQTIGKLRGWKTNNVAAHYFHLSSRDIDAPRKLGSPCWQYGQLSVRDGIVDFIVVYRNHDFFQKALGNYIGLGQLLLFICRESGLQPGNLVCHSIHAYCDTARNLKALIDA